MEHHHYLLTLSDFSLDEISKLIQSNVKIKISDEVIERVNTNRQYLDKKLNHIERPIYGINTGFGSLCNTVIPNDQIGQLQKNLVLSHACGVGPLIPSEMVQLIMLLKIKNLSLGCSGVRLELLERLVDMYNAGIYPEIHEMGSLGASGDLAPLAHLASALIGVGHVIYKGERMSAADALKNAGIDPIELAAKEGLALLNGTQFSTAYALHTVLESRKLINLANHIVAMSMDAYVCSPDPLDESIHAVRNQLGQIKVAAQLRSLLIGTELLGSDTYSVQDPYSFRCVPQVHGASLDAILYVSDIVEREINAVTDNPNVFDREDKILSGGNFHAQPIALALDFLAIALSEIGSISERRTYVFLGGQRGLPPFLIKDAGINSGMMILQYTAASIASQNKQLCTPASIDSIISCNGQEDHVSMAANAGTKAYRVVQNIKSLLAIELILSAQAKDLRKPLKSSSVIEAMHSTFRTYVPHMEQDTYLRDYIENSERFVNDWKD